MTAANPPVVPTPAATIVLLRDGVSGLEVLMLEKAAGSHFAAGALVFPGGKVDDTDRACCAAMEDHDAPRLLLKITAIREMFEECGIVLARRPNQDKMLSTADVKRGHDQNSDGSFHDLAQSAGVRLATDQLVYFAHWITPPFRSKRFDTHFFIAPAPPDQMVAAADGHEIVKADWRRPADVLDDATAGKVKLVLPTLLNLTKLSRWTTVADAMAETRNSTVVAVTPVRFETDQGTFARIPAEAGYGVTAVPADTFRLA